jgi:polyhydroxybutyrate depolymerase
MSNTIKRCVILFLVIAAIAGTAVFAQNRIDITAVQKLGVTGEPKTLEHQGRKREYRMHVPKSIDGSRPVPLVLFLHGGGGTAEQASRMGMTQVADQNDFIVAYPNSIDKHWNDGRLGETFKDHEQIDDVAFLTALVEQIQSDYKIDANRIFAAGASNGGFMSQRLAIDRPQIFSAVGVIIATMSEELSKDFKPEFPVSVLFMNGTADPLVPYDGGEVRVELFPQLSRLRNQPKQGRGKCISTDDAVKLWLKRNQLDERKAKTEMLSDKDQADESQIEYTLWQGGERDTAVALYKVVGGGHAVPGGTQYLPERLIGKTNRDIDGLETIWNFFKDHARHPAKE